MASLRLLTLIVMPAVLAASLSCASTRSRNIWENKFVRTQAIADSGDLARARARYEVLAKQAPNPKLARMCLLEIAKIDDSQGHKRRAQASYVALYRDPLRDESGARAMYIVAESRDSATRRELKFTIMSRYPDSVAAERALYDLRADKELARSALMTRILAIYPSVQTSELADNLLFAHAEMAIAQGDETAAMASWARIVREQPLGKLADDALWEMAVVYRRNQQWRPALRTLALLCNDVENSWMVGVYHSDWADDARYHMGMIHLLFLDDPQEAIVHFERFAEDFPDSILLDDARWYGVEARRLAGRPDYGEALAAFLRDHPKSRWARRAKQRGVAP